MNTITFSEYYDKVYGGWMGKCIGGSVGAAMENNKYLMDLEEAKIFPEEIPPNDDLDLQILWLQVLETKGIYLSETDLAEAWEKHCWYPFNEYGYFLHNFERKIDPPVSGWYNNQFFSQSMGSPIRSEIWGMIAPGNPQLSMEYACKDAVLDHEGESIWAEQMLAAVEAMAFFESDLNKLLDYGLTLLPQESRLRECILCVCSLFKAGVDWKKARNNILQMYGDPDASKTVQNIGLTILALLYGGKDFGKTMLLSVNCGYDTDCTCATAGAILGIMAGVENIPQAWKQQTKDTFVIGIDVQRRSNLISDLATDTCRVGIALSRTLNKTLEIINIPEYIDATVIPTIPPLDDVKINADYMGKPEIQPPKSKHFCLTLNSSYATPISGVLTLEVPQDLIVTPELIHLNLIPGMNYKVPIIVQYKENIKKFGSCAIILVKWQMSGRTCMEKEIGLATSQPYLVIGPFWDLYDSTDPQSKPYYDSVTNRIARPRGAENFNNYININTPYINETTFDSLPEGKVYYAAEHKLPIDDWIRMSGPACIYIVRDVLSECDRIVHLVAGNTDIFRVWHNNAEISVKAGTCNWMPYNHRIELNLVKGTNRIVIKIARYGRSSEFSLGFSEPDQFIVWLNDIVSVDFT